MTGAPIYWLIETGTPPVWYCGAGQWCNNANHAMRFPTRSVAEQYLQCFVAPGSHAGMRLTEHQWCRAP